MRFHLALLSLLPVVFWNLRLSEPVATKPEVAPARRPNILFCLADDASFPYMGAYGTDWVSTPAFDRVAREGLLFTRAYTPNSKCSPSRACLLTGRNSWQLEEAANHYGNFPAKFKTFMEVLGEHNYVVGYTQKGWAPGNPGTLNGKPRELTGKAFNQRTRQPPSSGITKNDYTHNFADFLDARPAGQPFCFWYGSLEPHRGYEYGTGLRQGKTPKAIGRVPAYWPDNDSVRTDMLDYAFELNYFDQHLGNMLALLEQRGELDNTIVVVTADNGMPFPRAKGQAYEISNHLPLAIMWKTGIKKPGRKIDDFVSFIDLAPTFLDVAGISASQSAMQPVQGKSLLDLLRSEQSGQIDPHRDYVLIGKERHDVGRPHDWGYPIRGMVKDNYLYVKNYEPDRWPAGNPETGYLNTDASPTKSIILAMRRRGVQPQYWQQAFGKRVQEELYDLRTDRDCLNNLALSATFAPIAKQMRRQMEQALTTQHDPRMKGQGYVFDQYPYKGLENGFYERFKQGEPIKAPWVNITDFEATPLGNYKP